MVQFNIPFILVVVVVFLMATLIVFFGDDEDSVLPWESKENPLLQIVLRWSLILVLVLIPFAKYPLEIAGISQAEFIFCRIGLMFVAICIYYVSVVVMWLVLYGIFDVLRCIVRWACKTS